MYPVTNLYKDKINKDGREFTCDIRIEHSQGTLNLTDEDLSMGSLTYTEATQSGDEYTIGSTIASDISFTIFNKPEYEDIQFMGATVFVTIGLEVIEGIDAHFLQPSQPSKMQGFEDDIWEYVPLGRFNIDEVNVIGNTIQLKAIDNMINLDKSYNLSKLTYPATLQQIYVNLCNVADVSVGTLNFPNEDYIVTNRPSDDLTLRDILGYVAELSGTFAKCTRTGSVELRWYEPTDLELSPEHRYDFTPSDDVIQITGILATVKGEKEEDDVTYITGSEGYTIDLTENALLQGGYETVLPNIYNNVKDTIFTPYSSNSKGNPVLQAGDIIKQIDKNGKEYTTIITKSVYKYRGKSTLEGKGLSQISKGYKGSTNRRLAEIKHKVDVEIGDKLTNLEQAMLNATELITGQLGGHVLKREGELLIMDSPDPESAVKVWRWNLGGLGYSSSGVDGIYETAMTMDGSINAKFITTGSLSANIVQAGLLQSTDGSTWINLDNGAFNFKDSIKWDSTINKVTLGSDVTLSWENLDEDTQENLKGEDGEDGEDGYTPVKGVDYFDGVDGQDGESRYLWIRYSQNSNGNPFVTDPTNAKYIGIATTLTNNPPSNYLSYSWSLIKGTDGIAGEDGENGETSYLHIKYSNNGTSFTANNGETVGAWIGTYVDFIEEDSMTFSKYTWNKVKGDDGYTPVKGTDYFDGVDGQDGQSNYIWVKYSASADGSNFGDALNKYIGIATTTTPTAPTLKTAYKWTKIEGTDGSNGVKGETGSDGQTSYLHIKYSNNGTSFTANNGETVGAYIGTYVDFIEADSMTFSKYTWNKVKGEDGYTPVKGTDYFDGVDGQDGESKYLWIKYSQNSNGNPATDSPTNAKYIGVATTITNVKPTSYLSYSWSLIKGTDGTNGVKGETGANGQTSYLHIKYSNNGTTFTGNSGENVGSWIGTYVDFVEADSTTFSRYTWNKVKGEDGSDGSDASVPNYITSTKITSTTIESPSITGGTITGGSITSNSTINVTTNAHIGNDLYLGSMGSSSKKNIWFNEGAKIVGGTGFIGYGIEMECNDFFVTADTIIMGYNTSSIARTLTSLHGDVEFDSNAVVTGLPGNAITRGTVPYARLPSANLVHSSGSGSWGRWIRFANGVQICWYNTSLTYTSGTTIDRNVTFPMPFSAPPAVSGNATESTTVVHRSLAVYFTSVTSSGCTALMSRPTGSTDFTSSDSRTISIMAIGAW